MSNIQKIAVTEKDASLRVDLCLMRWFPHLSRGCIQKWIRTGQLRVDGKRVKANYRLAVGQIVRIPPIKELEPSEKRDQVRLTAKDIALIHNAVIAQDEEIIVLNKPYGLAVQGGTKTYQHIDKLLDALKQEKVERPKLVHRLDKDTTGVLVLARTTAAARWLTKAFQEHQVQKSYWAVVVGIPDPSSGMVELSIAKQAEGWKEKMTINKEKGLRAVTSYKVLEQNLDHRLSWVELTPLTGRMHQLRVHCRALGTPILGDGKYGGTQAHPSKARSKMHLHAHSITFTSPKGQTKTFVAPPPLHMQETLKRLGFSLKKA